MSANPLNVIRTSSERSDYIPSRHLHKKQLEAKFERLWLINPEQFNPLRNCLQKERVDRSFNLLSKHVDLKNKNIVDIGCAAGVFSRLLRDQGAQVDAIDIATNALKNFAEFDQTHIHIQQATMPETQLSDDAYDVVVCLDLIAELPAHEHRLFFAELARIINTQGFLLCSSSIDIQSEDALERLLYLAQTEFEIVEVKQSYHALFIHLKNFIKIPMGYVEAWRDKKIREKELQQRKGFSYFWFYLNTSPFVIWFWSLLSFCAKPFLHWMKNSRRLLLSLEKICQFLSDEKGISHLIFLAKRKPLQEEVAVEKQPIEKPKKREIWE